MEHRTTMTVDDIVLHVWRCDWVRSLFDCHAWARAGSSRLAPLWQAMTTRSLKTCHLTPSPYDSRLSTPLSFAAYVSAWEPIEVAPGLLRHAITLAMTGPPWREDDTPVESHDDLWALMGYASIGEKG